MKSHKPAAPQPKTEKQFPEWAAAPRTAWEERVRDMDDVKLDAAAAELAVETQTAKRAARALEDRLNVATNEMQYRELAGGMFALRDARQKKVQEARAKHSQPRFYEVGEMLTIEEVTALPPPLGAFSRPIIEGGGWFKAASGQEVYVCDGTHKDGRSGFMVKEIR